MDEFNLLSAIVQSIVAFAAAQIIVALAGTCTHARARHENKGANRARDARP